MNTDHIGYFIEVIRWGSINKASEKLNINPQYLGKILTSLENEIGIKLLERNRTGITLTPQGNDVYNILKQMQDLLSQLKYNQHCFPNLDKQLKIYYFATSNYSMMNAFIMELRKTFPELAVQMIEDSSTNIIQNMLNDTVPALGTIRSFHDYPQLKISEELLAPELEVIGCSKNRIVALASPNNPILNKYDSISIESLLTKPLIIHAPYNIDDNDYYKLLKIYGTPQIKYITSNLQTYYEIMRDSDCISLGAISDNIYSMTNSLFSKEQQLRAIPIRENITFTKYRLINKTLNKANNTILRNLIIDSFL